MYSYLYFWVYDCRIVSDNGDTVKQVAELEKQINDN